MKSDQLNNYDAPVWAKSLSPIPDKRLQLAQLPTPIRRWNIPELDGAELFVKRDDMTGITLSGNKARKLEFLFADALQKGCDTVLTAGGIQSNHARATAVAARELGMDSHLFLNSKTPDADPGFAGNLLLDRMVGATIHQITLEEYFERDRLMAEAADELAKKGRTPYIIPEGGSNGLGTWGYLECIHEIHSQLIEMDHQIDDIVFACGSGGTATGLALGCALAGMDIRVHGVNVTWHADYFYQRIQDILDQMNAPFNSRELIDVIDGYVGLGYAKSRPEELELLRQTALTTGILLDPVYTGKAIYGLLEEWKTNRDRFNGHRILFIHTGGMFGLYDKINELAPLFTNGTPAS